MSTIAISSLPVVTTGTTLDVLPIVQNNVTSQITNADLFNSVSKINGVALGIGTGNHATNTTIGNDALIANTTALSNTAIGVNTLNKTTTGSNNTAVGSGVLLTNVSGAYNTGVGASSLISATGSYNTAIGRNAGGEISSGAKNTIIGNYSGNGGGLDIRTASNYVVLSDGDGNPRAYWNGADATFGGGLSLGGLVATNAVAPTVPSGSTITPLGSINFISGTTVVNNISALGNIAYTGGSVTLIPTGVWTWTTAGNIALAGTAVVSKALIMTYDYGTGKWYPSYV